MDNRNRDPWDSSNKPSSSKSDSDVSFGKENGRTDIEEIDRESEGDVERYEDTTPMSQRSDLSEH
ncbi:MAG TPA: hypothetical protein VIO12_06955 [Thermoanaerobaculia bacterium]